MLKSDTSNANQKLPDFIVECKMLCYSRKEAEENDKLRDLGLNSQAEPEDLWLNCVFDLQEVIMMKEVENHNECAVYTHTHHFVVDIPFEEMKSRWKKLFV